MSGQTNFTAKVEPEDFKNTLFLAKELSRSAWLVATFAPRLGDKISVHAIPGGDTKRLLELIGRLQVKLRGKDVSRVRTVCCYEAGYDGFWLHRVGVLGGAIVTRMGRDRLRARSSGRLAARSSATPPGAGGGAPLHSTAAERRREVCPPLSEAEVN